MSTELIYAIAVGGLLLVFAIADHFTARGPHD
jgi:hypothetical protein